MQGLLSPEQLIIVPRQLRLLHRADRNAKDGGYKVNHPWRRYSAQALSGAVSWTQCERERESTASTHQEKYDTAAGKKEQTELAGRFSQTRREAGQKELTLPSALGALHLRI